ncbi:hypothetical protein JMJ35_008212 [Cladonia borealis]|uniref:DNA replication regulator Sld3 C-terminal domain-containing protein n=1 Tax=Cladonia borealis TaxID=184061 RepID=A0AA39UZD6_9LECA|nr:hypothetical protein JMJ35_008212 [Cladonia borealis]
MPGMSTTHAEIYQSSSLGVSTPDTLIPDTSKPISAPFPPACRKRKHADVQEENGHIGLPFTIQENPSLPSAKPQRLIPRLLIPRSCLPLTYLDSAGHNEEHVAPRLFCARIESLEEDQQEGRLSNQPLVLIVQSAADDRLYAVEKVQDGIYALCKLGLWVTSRLLEGLQSEATSCSLGQRARIKEPLRIPTDKWWRGAAIESEPKVLYHISSAQKAPGIRLCLQKPVDNTCSPMLLAGQNLSNKSPEEAGCSLGGLIKETIQEPEEMLAMIRSQYQDSLYASKTSLAYFAKGPLSRARAAFQSQDCSSRDQSHLIEFLRNSILSLPTMDVKYRETILSIVKDLPFGPLSEDESASITNTLVKKIRKSKKTKVGKNGLYPGEEASITRWWLSRDAPATACDSADARENATRLALLEQRARETQLQIILALEVLALEAATTGSSIEQNTMGTVPEGDGESQQKRKKSKKPQDLVMLLDLLVDRLTIWQSMNMDEDKSSKRGDTPSSQHPVKSVDKTSNSDHLQQFCVDVVLPFYAARLPDLTALLCEKLGGPKQPSPRRPTLTKAPTSHSGHKTGTTGQRLQNRKPRRTLERVLTEERSGSQKPPSLLRSATDPVLPQLKREASDTSLSSIPLNRVAMQKRYSQREVDLHAASQATEVKLKKKAKIDHELQSAIAALKKPNPRMAVKELVEDAEKRVAGSHSRKSKHPVRNPLAQSVQVTATPRKNRKGNPFALLPQIPPLNATPSTEDLENVPPSSVTRIPSSTKRLPSTSVDRTTQRLIDTLLPSIEQTPTRGPSKTLHRAASSSAVTTLAADIVQSSPVGPGLKRPDINRMLSASYEPLSWATDIHETPTKNRTTYLLDRAEEPVIEATPIQNLSTHKAPSPTMDERQRSIYASLGWDDDVDELA